MLEYVGFIMQFESGNRPAPSVLWEPDARASGYWPLLATAAFYALVAFRSLQRTWSAPPSSAQLTILTAVIVGTYATLSLLALLRRPRDQRVRVFAFAGCVVTLSLLLLPSRGAPFAGWPGQVAWALAWQVYFSGAMSYLHMAALVPRPHPILDNHPYWLRFHYGTGAILGFAVYWIMSRSPSFLSQFGFTPYDAARTLNIWTYLYIGLAGLLLLGSRVRSSGTMIERRQAIVVLAGWSVWTLNLARWAFFPHLVQSAGANALLELIAVLAVAVSFFMAIAGLRLFETPMMLRDSAIYAATGGILFAALYALIRASLVAQLGPREWDRRPMLLIIMLFVAGALFQPLARWIRRQTNRLFYPDRLALRRLEEQLIPELARYTDLTEMADLLTHQIRAALDCQQVFLLLADDRRELFRTRSENPASGIGESLTIERRQASELEPLRAGLPFLTGDWAYPIREHTPTLIEHAIDVVVPIHLDQTQIGLLLLVHGNTQPRLLRAHLHPLDRIAHQAAAMLENARLFDQAQRDGLTGLPRRHVFQEALTLEIERIRRNHQPFTVGFIDLDDLKQINDQHGHSVGDRALLAVANAVENEQRQQDVICRFGGDEFAMLLPETGREGAVARCQRLLSHIQRAPIPLEGGRRLDLTLSIGLSVATDEFRDLQAESLLREADEALYRAKARGKNQIVIH